MRLLVVSPVAPFPTHMASKVRVANILKAVSNHFEVTFLAVCPAEHRLLNERSLESAGVEALLLPPINRETEIRRLYHKAVATGLWWVRGIPSEFYYTSMLNLTPDRLRGALSGNPYDVVLVEYWFTSGVVDFFGATGTPCVLDLHDVMWQKRATTRDGRGIRFYADYLDRRYRTLEESSWALFDGLISINLAENKYLREVGIAEASVACIGMGVNLSEWPLCWMPSRPYRVVFYGSLSGRENVRAALRCANSIMPAVWKEEPGTELWFVGAHPHKSIRDLERSDGRVHVTGFLDCVVDTLSRAVVGLCPLTGRYGFRSRLIEEMAIGLPLVVSDDSVYGMGIENGKGVTVCRTDHEMAEMVIRLLRSPAEAMEQSRLARQQVEERFSFEATYAKVVPFLQDAVRTG